MHFFGAWLWLRTFYFKEYFPRHERQRKTMKFKRMTAVIISAAVALSLTACSNSQNNSGGTLWQSGGNSTKQNTVPWAKPMEKPGLWDALPEIPETDAAAFKYEYNSNMGGMVITDYLKESPKVRIPDTLENEPVVGVDLHNCKKQLTELVMPDSVFKMRISDETENSLQYMNMPADGMDYNVAAKYDPDYVGKMTAEKFHDQQIKVGHDSFTNCKNLLAIGVSEKCERYTAIDGVLYYDYNGRKVFLVCPQGKSGTITVPNGTTEIGNWAFYNCGKITSITIPDSVIKIGNAAFKNCQLLESITIPDGVTKIENNIFDGCTALTSVTYKGKTYDRFHIGELFDIIMYPNMSGGMLIENNKLTKVSENAVSIEIPDTVTEISDDALNGCNKLEKIKYKNKTYTLSKKSDLIAAIHGEEGLTITSDGKLTKVSPELTEVKIPDRVTEIESDTYGTHKTAFKDCDHLKKVTFGKGITELEGMSFAMAGKASIFGLDSCKNISEIIIPESVTSINYFAFYDCKNLKKVTLPNSLKSIDMQSFENCANLSEIAIPNGVTVIGSGVFSNCTSLTNITIPDSVTKIAVHKEIDDPVVGHMVVSDGAFDGCINIKVTYKGKTYDYAHIDDLYKAINGG